MAVHTFQTPQAVELEIKIPAGAIEVETIDGTESTIELIGNDRLVEQIEVVQNGRRSRCEYKKRFGLRIEIGDLTWGRERCACSRASPTGATRSSAPPPPTWSCAGRFASLDAKSAAGDLVVDGTSKAARASRP